MQKGISAVVATILMVMIVIALAGTAYFFMSGMLTSKTTTAFEILYFQNPIIVLRNIGTENITQMNVFLDSEEIATSMLPISPGAIGYINISSLIPKGPHNLLIRSSSMSQRIPISIEESITDRNICQTAHSWGLCDGLDLTYGEGYRQNCCTEYGLCC